MDAETQQKKAAKINKINNLFNFKSHTKKSHIIRVTVEKEIADKLRKKE